MTRRRLHVTYDQNKAPGPGRSVARHRVPPWESGYYGMCAKPNCQLPIEEGIRPSSYRAT